MAGRRFWTLIIILLIAVIVAGGIVAWQRYSPPHPIEISLPQTPELDGEVNPAELPQKIDINRAETWLLEALPGKAYLIDERTGHGHIILYADDPNFRAYWDGLNRLFLNSLLFGPSIGR